MDKVLQSYPSVVSDDLQLCYKNGVAYQREPGTIEYNHDYWQHYVELAKTNMGCLLTDFRVELVRKYCSGMVLDVGIGAGQFMLSHGNALGYDVNPVAIRWLHNNVRFYDPYEHGVAKTIQGVTLWDVFEHFDEPSEFLKLVPQGCYVFMSLPVFADVFRIRQSKHYKPREHKLYVTPNGLIDYCVGQGFEFLEVSDKETQLGREDVMSFVFRKS